MAGVDFQQPGGKDIYCEKAMTRTVAEGQAVVKAVRENQCVFQVGQQQCSDPIFALAVKMVRDGDLGDLRTIKVGVPYLPILNRRKRRQQRINFSVISVSSCSVLCSPAVFYSAELTDTGE